MENNDFQFKWISCDGGPLLVAEVGFLQNWEGCEPPSNGRIFEADFRWGFDVATDYDRACDVEDWLGWIDVGDGKALVLSGDELATTWFKLNESEGMLLRWMYADNEEDLIRLAKEFSNSLIKAEDIEFVVETNNLVLMATCESWDDNIYPRLRFSLQKGIYKIFTNEFSDERTSFISHHFKKI